MPYAGSKAAFLAIRTRDTVIPVLGHLIVDANDYASLFAEVNISGRYYPEWERQVGSCTGIQSDDPLSASRYILLHVSVDFGMTVFSVVRQDTASVNGQDAIRREGLV